MADIDSVKVLTDFRAIRPCSDAVDGNRRFGLTTGDHTGTVFTGNKRSSSTCEHRASMVSNGEAKTSVPINSIRTRPYSPKIGQNFNGMLDNIKNVGPTVR